MSFTDEEVLTKEPSLHWVKVTSSRPSKLAESETMWNEATVGVGKTTLGVLFHDPQYGMLKAHHPCNGKHLDCFQPDVWYLDHFQPMGKNTTREPLTPMWMPPPGFAEIARSFERRQPPMYNHQCPTRTDHGTRLFGRNCHDHNNVYLDVARHSDRHYLFRYSNSLYESCKLGVYPHGS